MRKPVFGDPDQGRLKGCSTTQDGYRLEISNIGSRGVVLYICSENKGAEQLWVTAKLICIFVFAYAKIWFSYDAAHITHQKFKVKKYKMTSRATSALDTSVC